MLGLGRLFSSPSLRVTPHRPTRSPQHESRHLTPTSQFPPDPLVPTSLNPSTPPVPTGQALSHRYEPTILVYPPRPRPAVSAPIPSALIDQPRPASSSHLSPSHPDSSTHVDHHPTPPDYPRLLHSSRSGPDYPDPVGPFRPCSDSPTRLTAARTHTRLIEPGQASSTRTRLLPTTHITSSHCTADRSCRRKPCQPLSDESRRTRTSPPITTAPHGSVRPHLNSTSHVVPVPARSSRLVIPPPNLRRPSRRIHSTRVLALPFLSHRPD